MTKSTSTKPKPAAKPQAYDEQVEANKAPTTPLTGKAKADYDKRVAAQTEKPAPKRRNFTPEQRIAKLEAQLSAAKSATAAHATKQVEKLEAQRGALVVKRNDLDLKIQAIAREIEAFAPKTDAV